jgi:secondary thiamine-phosphate synthase enzyme
MFFQQRITLSPRPRGLHLITTELTAAIPEIRQADIGLLNVFLQHTSASLTINENADPDVQVDLESSLNSLAPEDFPYVHTLEGPDDMPAHVKASLFGCSLNVPVAEGRLALGVWQGIYLCEHRDRASRRNIVLTLHAN